jgi:hypothetical protein
VEEGRNRHEPLSTTVHFQASEVSRKNDHLSRHSSEPSKPFQYLGVQRHTAERTQAGPAINSTPADIVYVGESDDPHNSDTRFSAYESNEAR